jgi:DNA-binding PadR family transcriptional regulator
MDFLALAELEVVGIFQDMEYPHCMNNPHGRRLPLTRDAFAILVALSAGEQTGADVQNSVVADGVGLYVGPSSVYTVLHRLVQMGWATEDQKHYKLTDKGWKQLRNETRTLDALVAQAKRRVVASGRGRW